MEIQKEDDEYLWGTCLNPQHEDNNASLCINKVDSGKYKRGYGYCYSCGFTIQFSEEAIKKMSNKKSIARKKVPVDWLNLQYSYTERLYAVPVKPSLDWKIPLDILDMYCIGWDGQAWTFPMRDDYGSIIGMQRRFVDTTKYCVNGSQLGLFTPICSNKNVVITEGLSDATVATHLGYFGIGKPSAGFGEQIVRKYLENINYAGTIIIVADNDSAGVASKVKLQIALEEWDTKVIVPDTDLRQYYLDNGANTTRALLKM